MSLPLTHQQRVELGQQRRKQVRRTGHATFTAKHRKEAPLKLLAASVKGRVPSLIAIKNERMAASPFGYFRGAVPVMAYDLSLMPNTGIVNQLCGDAHVRNLGAFAAPDGSLVFDINDFDETIVGPFEWDVKRMATSLVLAGREAGAKSGHCQEAAAVFLERYRRNIQIFSRMPVLEVARHQVHRLNDVEPVANILKLAERATPLHNLLQLTEPAPPAAASKTAKKSSKKAGIEKEAAEKKLAPVEPDSLKVHRIFKTIEPTLTRLTGAAAQSVLDSLATYTESLLPERRHFLAQYTALDVAFKVVGTGSVGLRDYCIYMEGNGSKDPLFLQIKEEAVSAYAGYLSHNTESASHQGRRVVEGIRAMQLQSDPFLGWTTIKGRDYLVRQLNDHKASIDVSDLRAGGLLEYAGVCGEMLARGHARSGDSAVLAGYIGSSERFDEAVGAFAEAYANQTELDWKQLVRSLHIKPTAKAN
jgi:uncharacterized protein (DUF2252 family)